MVYLYTTYISVDAKVGNRGISTIILYAGSCNLWHALTSCGKCSNISNTSWLKKVYTNSADPDQSASEETVQSGSSLFAILTCSFTNSTDPDQTASEGAV